MRTCISDCCLVLQVSATGKKDYQTPEGIRGCPAPALLTQLA